MFKPIIAICSDANCGQAALFVGGVGSIDGINILVAAVANSDERRVAVVISQSDKITMTERATISI